MERRRMFGMLGVDVSVLVHNSIHIWPLQTNACSHWWGHGYIHSLGRLHNMESEMLPWGSVLGSSLCNQGNLNFRYKEERSDCPPKSSVFTDWHVLFNVEIPREPQFEQLLFPTAQLCSFLLPWGLKWLQMKRGVRVLVGVELLYISHCPNPLTLTPKVFPTPPSRRVRWWKGCFDSQSPFHTTPSSILKDSVGPSTPKACQLGL